MFRTSPDNSFVFCYPGKMNLVIQYPPQGYNRDSTGAKMQVYLIINQKCVQCNFQVCLYTLHHGAT